MKGRKAEALERKKEAALFFARCLQESPISYLIARVILFGSVAKGTAEKDSDVDLIVLSTRDLEPVRDCCADIQLETWLKFREPVEPLVHSLEALRTPDNHFLRRALKEGEEIYTMEPDKIKQEEARNFLELAIEFLEGASAALKEGYFRVAVDAAYNAAELCAKGLILFEVDELPRSHGGVVGEFGRLYVQTGRASPELGRRFSRALELRGRARYERSAEIDQGRTAQIISVAEEMLTLLKSAMEVE